MAAGGRPGASTPQTKHGESLQAMEKECLTYIKAVQKRVDRFAEGIATTDVVTEDTADFVASWLNGLEAVKQRIQELATHTQEKIDGIGEG